MLRLPAIPMLSEFHWEQVSQQWDSLVLQTKKIADGAGQGEEYQVLEQNVKQFVARGNVDQLKKVLLKRKGVRVLTQLWIDKKEIRESTLNEAYIDYIEAQHPKLGMSSLMNLVTLVYRYFDELVDGNIFNRLTQWLKQQIEQRLKERKKSSDTILSVLQQSSWLFELSAPKTLVKLAKQNHFDLNEQLKKLHLNELPQGRFLDICNAQYYLDTLREIPVGEQHDILHELLKDKVARMPYEEGKRIGHIALEIIIDRSAGDPSEVWQNFVIDMAGDPRIASTSKNYREWWKPIGEDRVKTVTSWLAKEDLRLFLGAIEEYANQTRDEGLSRMFPARKRFLEGLYEHGFVRNARLMLGHSAAYSVKKLLGKNVTTNYINLKGMAQTSIIYLDCGDFHIIEGSHSFKLWIYMGLPSEKLADYSFNEVSHFNLTNSFPREFQKNYPNGLHTSITHNPSSWQSNAIEFLTENGIELDLEKLFYRDEYKRYVSRYGLPVMKDKVQRVDYIEPYNREEDLVETDNQKLDYIEHNNPQVDFVEPDIREADYIEHNTPQVDFAESDIQQSDFTKSDVKQFDDLEMDILKAIRLHQPIKSEELVKVLAKEFALRVDHQTIKLKLSYFLTEDIATYDSRFAWSLIN